MRQVLVLERTPIENGEAVQTIESAAAEALDEIPALAQAVFITVEDNNIRYWLSGADPTALFGHLVVAASYQNLYLANRTAIENLRMIGIGGNAEIHVTYYK